MFQRLVFLLVLLAAATASAQNQIAPNPTISAPVTGPGAMFPGLQRVPAGTGLADQKYVVRSTSYRERRAASPTPRASLSASRKTRIGSAASSWPSRCTRAVIAGCSSSRGPT